MTTLEVNSDNVAIRIKIITLGSSGCGKSCLVKRFCEERFVSKFIPTIGVDYGVKPVKILNKLIKVNFWDFSGQPEYFEIRNEFYKDTQGILLVFDISSRNCFTDLDAWLEEAAKYECTPENQAFILCANKSDKKSVVSEEEIREWASKHNLKYFETSALTGSNVSNMFITLFEKVLEKIRAVP